MFNLGAFLLDPLNISGMQTPQAPQRPQGAPPSAAPGMLYPELQPDLNPNEVLNPPPGGPSGDADGRTTKGFLQSMLGKDFQMGPGRELAPGWQPPPPPPSQWTYQQGKGPVWQGYEKGRTQSEYKPVFNPTFTGNRF